MMRIRFILILELISFCGSSAFALAVNADPWIHLEGSEGTGQGKHIVLISGDEEYRSEEALPQLARILATHHGFRCTVLFAIHPDTGIIQPNRQNNIPGLAALESADLMILFTRFRALPDEQMERIDDYLKSGQPIIGVRTATHAFQFPADSKWAHYSNGYEGDQRQWRGGFGRLVLGEKWIAHHGQHKHQSTRGVIAADAAPHPIVRGLTDGDVWGPSDVYQVRLPLAAGCDALLLGQVAKRTGAFDAEDPLYGMRPTDQPDLDSAKNNPAMPIAWTKTYTVPGGRTGRAFMSTIGASTDLLELGTRRLLVNAAYWCLGWENKIPPGGAAATIVGQYHPTQFEFRSDEYWNERAIRPSDLVGD
jgi:hypothetical protein